MMYMQLSGTLDYEKNIQVEYTGPLFNSWDRLIEAIMR